MTKLRLHFNAEVLRLNANLVHESCNRAWLRVDHNGYVIHQFYAEFRCGSNALILGSLVEILNPWFNAEVTVEMRLVVSHRFSTRVRRDVGDWRSCQFHVE